jgi:preprotein translocase subunit SecA
VDIVTSNKALAKRDATDRKRIHFYEMLGLTVSHNTDHMKKQEYRKAYDAVVVYGDLGSFQGDMLREIMLGKVI